MLAEQRNAGSRESGRALMGSTLRSREKHEEACVLSSKTGGMRAWVQDAGGRETKDRPQHGERSSSLPGGHLLPRELWIEKSLTCMTVSDNT